MPRRARVDHLRVLVSNVVGVAEDAISVLGRFEFALAELSRFVNVLRDVRFVVGVYDRRRCRGW